MKTDVSDLLINYIAMGKEILGAIRLVNSQVTLTQSSATPDIIQELVVEWDVHNMVCKENIVENAGVYITLIGGLEDRFYCTGFGFRGNRFVTLISLLKKKGLVPHIAKVEKVFVTKGLEQIRVNIRKDCFLARDHIIIVLGRTIKKSIKKAKKRLRK